MPASSLMVLCLASALCYVVPTVAMRLGGSLPFLLLLVPVLAFQGLAAWFEFHALLGRRLLIVALLIPAIELMVLVGVALGLGERYSAREVAGLLLIAGGMVLLAGVGEGPHQAAGAISPS